MTASPAGRRSLVSSPPRGREIETPRFDLYGPHRQAESDVQHFTVRTTIDPVEVAPDLAAESTAFDTALSIGGVTTMEEIVRRTRGPWHFNMIVFSLFGAVALALAAVGLFGLVAYEVAQRSREIGVRMALGAQRSDVVRLMVGQGARPAALGLLSGIAASLLVTRAGAAGRLGRSAGGAPGGLDRRPFTECSHSRTPAGNRRRPNS